MITFKQLTQNDLSLLYRWFQVPHVKKWYARGEEYSYEMIKDKYIDRIDNQYISNYIILVDNNPIGYIQLYHVSRSLPDGVNDYYHSLFAAYKAEDMAGIDLFVAETQYLGKGYASKALKQFINNYVKGRFKLLISDPSKDNEISIHFFTRNGFQEFKPSDSSSIYKLMVLNLSE